MAQVLFSKILLLFPKGVPGQKPEKDIGIQGEQLYHGA